MKKCPNAIPFRRVDYHAYAMFSRFIEIRQGPGAVMPFCIIGHHDTWVGNTFGGDGHWVQNAIASAHVTPDGTVIAASDWDVADVHDAHMLDPEFQRGFQVAQEPVLGLIAKAVCWLKSDGLFLGHPDIDNLKLTNGRWIGGTLGKHFKKACLTYDRKRRLLQCQGRRLVEFPFTYTDITQSYWKNAALTFYKAMYLCSRN